MDRQSPHDKFGGAFSLGISCLVAVFAFLFAPADRTAQKIVWTAQEKPIVTQIGGLRELPDDVRARTTKQLAVKIRELSAAPHRVELANDLANLSTEGDFGRDTLQEVVDTLASALRERPVPADNGKPALPYIELAQLVHFEHIHASLDDPQFAAAMSVIERADHQRQHASFTLTDLQGNAWSLQQLHGKVVLVNFWATWCPPCREEIPDLQTLYNRFKGQGLVILGISDEDAGTVKSFLGDKNVTYPVLLDPGRKVNDLFQVQGIPKSFVYDRDGKLVSESIDMRTQKQFLGMLAQAGLH